MSKDGLTISPFKTHCFHMETIKELQNIAIFVKVAETGSFSRAGVQLGISKSQVSKALKALEEELGVSLFNRNTRQVHLTQKGEQYFEHCRQAVAALEFGKTEILSSAKEPRGLLRVTMAGVFSEKFVAPCLMRLAKKYPHIEIEAHFDSKIVNILESKYDVAIRIGNLPDSDLRSKKLASREEVVVASPLYLRSKKIAQLEDLKNSNCLGSDSVWSFIKNGKTIKIDVRGNFKSNNPRVVAEAVKAGLGIAKLPTAYVAEEVKKGKLVSLLQDYVEPAKDIWFITPHKIKYNFNAELFYNELMEYLKNKKSHSVF